MRIVETRLSLWTGPYKTGPAADAARNRKDIDCLPLLALDRGCRRNITSSAQETNQLKLLRSVESTVLKGLRSGLFPDRSPGYTAGNCAAGNAITAAAPSATAATTAGTTDAPYFLRHCRPPAAPLPPPPRLRRHSGASSFGHHHRHHRRCSGVSSCSGATRGCLAAAAGAREIQNRPRLGRLRHNPRS